MKQVLKTIGWIVLVYLVIVGIGTVATSYNSQSVDNKQAKTSFMEGCDTGQYSGARFNQTSFCECTWTEITNVFGVEEVAKDGLNLTEDQILDKYESYAKSCMRQQGVEV